MDDKNEQNLLPKDPKNTPTHLADIPKYRKTSTAKKILIVSLGFLSFSTLIIGGYFLYGLLTKGVSKGPSSFEECVDAPKSEVHDTYPSVCTTQNGFQFINKNQPSPTITTYPEPLISNPTVSWETHKNTKNSFSFKYPPEATLGQRVPDPFPVAIQAQYIDPEPLRGGGPGNPGWLIIVSETQPNLEKLTLRQWAEENKLTTPEPNLNISAPIVNDTIIAGEEAITWKSPLFNTHTLYLVQRSAGVTFILINITSPFAEQHQKTVDQILSTFKFLPDTTGWKTHSSTRHKYSFKYPQTWDLLAYKEDDPEVAFGAHTLQNYDPNGVEKYMNHGYVNWQEFMGNKPAIKIDFAVNTQGINPFSSPNMDNYIREITKNATQLSESDLQIDNILTTQFKQTEDLETTEMPKSYQFYAFPREGQLVWISLYFWNADTYEEVKQSEDWKTLSDILSTFEFSE